jgi:hypothetical protein
LFITRDFSKTWNLIKRSHSSHFKLNLAGTCFKFEVTINSRFISANTISELIPWILENFSMKSMWHNHIYNLALNSFTWVRM